MDEDEFVDCDAEKKLDLVSWNLGFKTADSSTFHERHHMSPLS